MSEKLEGTMRLEGLIEGTMPPFPDARQKVEKWGENFLGGSVHMNVQFDGNHFSAMPSNDPFEVKAMSPDGLEPSNVIADGIADLLRYFPPLERSQVFSTIRSVEYRSKLEVQTLYAVGPEGRAVTRQQSVPCETTRGDEPISRKDMLKRGVVGVIVAAIVLGLSTLFVDYRSLWRHLTSRVENVTVTVDNGNFSPYFSVEVTGLDLANGTLQLKIKRTAAYPRDEASFDALYNNPPEVLLAPATNPSTATAPGTSTGPATASAPAGKPPEFASMIRRHVAIESLIKGFARLDFYDKDGKIIGNALVRLDELENVEMIQTTVSAPEVNRQPVAPARIVVMPQ